MKLASVGPVVSYKIFENTHTHILAHQNTTALRVVPDEIENRGGEGGALKAKHYYIFMGVAGLFFFQSSGKKLAFVNFLQVMVFLKNAVCSNGICWNEKKMFLFLEESSPEKTSYVSAMVVVLTDKLTL